MWLLWGVEMQGKSIEMSTHEALNKFSYYFYWCLIIIQVVFIWLVCFCTMKGFISGCLSAVKSPNAFEMGLDLWMFPNISSFPKYIGFCEVGHSREPWLVLELWQWDDDWPYLAQHCGPAVQVFPANLSTQPLWSLSLLVKLMKENENFYSSLFQKKLCFFMGLLGLRKILT